MILLIIIVLLTQCICVVLCVCSCVRVGGSMKDYCPCDKVLLKFFFDDISQRFCCKKCGKVLKSSTIRDFIKCLEPANGR